MKEFSTQTLKYIGDKIESPILFSIIVVISFFLYLTKSAWVKLIGSLKFSTDVSKYLWVRKNSKNMFNIEDLRNHSVFRILHIQKLSHYYFKTHGEEDLSKNLAFKQFIEAKMDSTILHLNKIIDEATEDMGELELRALIGKKFSDCNCNLEKVLIKKYTEEKGGISKESADTLINKFLTIREAVLLHYNDIFDNVFADKAFVTNYQLLSVAFHLVANEAPQIVENAKTAFDQINGAFLESGYGQ